MAYISTLPSFEDCFQSALVCQRNMICYSNDSDLVVDRIKEITDLSVHVVESYAEMNIGESSVTDGILVLPNLDSITNLQQYKLPRHLKRLKNAAGRTLCVIGLISIGNYEDCGLVTFLKNKFWFACSAPDLSLKPQRTDLEHIVQCRKKVQNVTIHPSIRRYVLDIIVHIRMHRLSRQASGGGASTASLRDVLDLCQMLSFKDKRDFVIPESVKLACQWYFPMHMDLIGESSEEISLLYGSNPILVQELVEKLKKFSIKKGEDTNNPLFLQLLVVQNVLDTVVPAL